jgi:hypothetical protein
MGTGVKLQGREADHTPSTAKVKNELSYTSNPHMPSWRARVKLYAGFVVKDILQVNCVRECRGLGGKVTELLESDVPR